ncbi:MAG: S8 family serine peptidase [Clostridia bacterium]|nr:S8 family serine peptidase [Clostridia bacterium]
MFKRLFSLILSFYLLLAAVSEGGFAGFTCFADNKNENGAFSRYIVTFRKDADADSLLEGYEYKTLSRSEKVYLVTAEDISFLSQYTLSAEKELPRNLLTVSQDGTWMDKCSISEAWELSSDLNDIVIAILDTGIERSHGDLKNIDILEGYDATLGKNGVYADSEGHGTAVAGIISSVAKGAKIYPVKVSSGGMVYSSALVEGIYNAVDNGADIINVSLGGYSYSVSEQNAINYALSNGCIVVAAAGNDGADASLAGKYFYPASYDGVVSVASVDNDGVPAHFSQFNDKVTVAAPGSDIIVCHPQEDYTVSSGTSLSAAIVSGVAALARSGAKELDGEQFKYLLMSVLGTKHSPYTGYGVINAADIVKASFEPIITGIFKGALLTEPTQIFFNKGTAKLNGKTFDSGDWVKEEGQHVFSLTFEDKTINISFTVKYGNLDYSVTENSIVFNEGFGYLDGMPYESGTAVPAGYHRFVLKNEFSSLSATVNIGGTGYIRGVENGETYSSSVAVTAYGEGIFTVNGTEFSGTKVLSDGEYTASVTDLYGALVYSCSFTVKTEKKLHTGFGHENVIFADREQGFLLAADDSSLGFRVYDILNLSAPLRTFKTVSKVIGFEADDKLLYVILESGVYSVSRTALKDSLAPSLEKEEGYIPFGGYEFEQNTLLFGGQKVLTTPYGSILSVNDNILFTSRGCVDILSGRLLYTFCDTALSVTDGYVLFENTGLVEFSDITQVAFAGEVSEVGYSVLFNDYTSFALLSVHPEQTAFDPASGKIFMLSDGAVYYTDASFITSGRLAFTDIPLYITAGGGELAVFFKDSCCIIDCNTLDIVSYFDIPCPEKAVISYYGLAAFAENELILVHDGGISIISDISVSDIAVSLDKVYVANSQGIGIFGFDGKYLGSIDSGDTKKVYTDGVYLTSRDTVYLTADGSEYSRIPADIRAVMNGLVFTASGVYTADGELVSDYAFDGIFAEGYCVTTSGASVTVHGASFAGKTPQIQNGEGTYQEAVEIASDLGLLFIDGKPFYGGEYTLGGKHRLECVMPFGIIFASEFYVVPALTGISVSGGNRELNLGESRHILVEYLPYGASAVPAEFSVEGNSVTVDKNGLMIAVEEGVSVITVTAGGFSATVTVNVVKLLIEFTDEEFIYDEATRTVRIPAGITVAGFVNTVKNQDTRFRILKGDGIAMDDNEIIFSGAVMSFVSDTGESIGSIPIIVVGDTDCDGMLTASDIRVLVEGIEGEDISLHAFYAGDCNFDGVLDSSDTIILLSLINESYATLPQPDGSLKVTASVPATLHPASEFSVVLYVDGGIGIDSVFGTFAFDDERLELMYVAGLDYLVEYTEGEGNVTFAAYEKDGTPSNRVIKSFAALRFRVKSDIKLDDMAFTLQNCGVTAVGNVIASESVVKTSAVKKRTSADFSIRINNAEYFVFNPTIRNYSVTVPFNAVNLDIEFDYPEGGIIVLSDTVIPESDELTVNIKYTSPTGVSTNYKIQVIRREQELLNGDPFLESITVSCGELTPEFVSERLKYKLVLSYEMPSPEFSFVARNENTVVSIDAPESFAVGSTDVLIHCVAQDGTSVTYTVTVERKAKIISEPSDGSEPIDKTGENGVIIAVAAAVSVTVIVLVIIFVIYRKEKKNVQKDL